MASITLGGKPSNTIGNLPNVGAEAPNFIAITRDFKSISLDDLKGKKILSDVKINQLKKQILSLLKN